MGTLTFLAYVGIVPLVFATWSIIHRLVSNHIADIDLRNLKVVQLPNYDEVGMRAFLDYGPTRYSEYIFRNGNAIRFYTTKFRMVESFVAMLYFASVIWGVLIFSRISMYGIDVTPDNITRFILDCSIGVYFMILAFSLYKMRKLAIKTKLDYSRYIS